MEGLYHYGGDPNPNPAASHCPPVMGILLTSWYVTSWYVVNIGMVMLNKAVVSQIFMYPVTLTLVHQAFCWLMGEVRPCC